MNCNRTSCNGCNTRRGRWLHFGVHTSRHLRTASAIVVHPKRLFTLRASERGGRLDLAPRTHTFTPEADVAGVCWHSALSFPPNRFHCRMCATAGQRPSIEWKEWEWRFPERWPSWKMQEKVAIYILIWRKHFKNQVGRYMSFFMAVFFIFI